MYVSFIVQYNGNPQLLSSILILNYLVHCNDYFPLCQLLLHTLLSACRGGSAGV